MAPKSKGATEAPTITTHHSMAAGGQPSAAHESPEVTTGEDAKIVLTRPKKLILQPMRPADTPDDESDAQASKAAPEAEEIENPDEDAPLVLETAAAAEAAASKLAAKLPEDKIELPLEEVALEEATEDEPSEQPRPVQVPESSVAETGADSDVKDPGESAGAAAEVDPNEARAQKVEALMASGKYMVRIHESSRSRAGLTVAIITGALVILAAIYWAAAEGMLGVGIDLPKFW